MTLPEFNPLLIPPAEIPGALIQLAAWQSQLAARLVAASVERDEPRPADREPARLMTAAEVSERLGFKKGYVYELARAGKIKSLRQGKYTRFTEAALSEYIAGNGAAAALGINNMLSSRVDTGKQPAYGVIHEPRRVQKRSQHNRPHANGAGAPPGRASDDRQSLGARIRVDP
jgi:excisionase family DNA binding protein